MSSGGAELCLDKANDDKSLIILYWCHYKGYNQVNRVYINEYMYEGIG